MSRSRPTWLWLAAFMTGCFGVGDLPAPSREPEDASSGHASASDGGLDAQEGAEPVPDASEPDGDGPDGTADAELPDPRPDGPEIVTISLPEGEAGVAYAAMLVGNGAPGAALHWSVAAAQLPAGIEVGALEGDALVLSGTPAISGDFRLTVSLSDGERTSSSELMLHVAPSQAFELEAQVLPRVPYKRPYRAELTVRNAQSPLSFRLVGSLPEGLTLEATQQGALISGGTSKSGSYVFEVEAEDAQARIARRRFVLHVQSSKAYLAASLRDGLCAPFDAVVSDVSSLSDPRHPVPLPRDEGSCARDFSFSPSGEFLYFVANKAQTTTHSLVDLRGGTSETLGALALTPQPVDRAPLWAPDGKRFLYWSEGESEQTYHGQLVITAGESVSFQPLFGEFSGEATWSADGQKLAVVTGDGGSLIVYSFEGDDALSLLQWRVGDALAPASDLRFTPDGAGVVYRLGGTAAPGVYLLDVSHEERVPVRILSARHPLPYGVLSRDGQRMTVLDDDEPVAHMFDFGVKYPHQWRFELEDGVHATPRGWASDARRLLLRDPLRKAHYVLQPGTPAQVLEPPVDSLLTNPLDEVAWMTFMPERVELLAGVYHAAGGVVVMSGSIYGISDGKVDELMSTFAEPAEPLFAGVHILVHDNELLDLSGSPPRPRRYDALRSPAHVRTDPARSRIYYYVAEDTSLNIVDATKDAEPVLLHNFELESGTFEAAHSP